MRFRFNIRDLLWLTALGVCIAVVGCGKTPAPAEKTEAQKAIEANEKALKESSENMDRIGKALLEYEKTHPPKYDEHGVPLKSESP